MSILLKKVILAGIITLVTAPLTLTSSASAHVVVTPSEVTTASFQTFTIGVPNEKDVPTTQVTLTLPTELRHVSPTQKSGWAIEVTKKDYQDNTVATSITWSGSVINTGLRDDFTFSAQAPAAITTLDWKAYQTYADGTVVAWDKGDSNNYPANTGPFSTTRVVSETAVDTSLVAAENTATKAKHTANNALYAGITSICISFIAVYFSTRKR